MTARLRRAASDQKTDPARVTMRDIARMAGGVHPSTVSLALRDNPSISAALRKRIKAIAIKAGYRRDPLLDAFNARRLTVVQNPTRPVIAFLADFPSRQAMMDSPCHGPLWADAVRAAEALHHQAEFFSIGKEGLSSARLEAILQTRGICSLLIAALRCSTRPPELNWDRYCTVRIECLDWDVPGYTVANDHRQGARLAVTKACEAGYQRVGLALTPASEGATNDLLRAGYLIEQRSRAGAPPAPPLLLRDPHDPKTLESWILAHELDAVLSGDARLGPLLARMPPPARAIAWASLDTLQAADGVSTLVPSSERLATLAVGRVVSLERANQRGLPSTASCTFSPVSWRDGRSLPVRSRRLR